MARRALVVGSGGREHALVRALGGSGWTVFAAPGITPVQRDALIAAVKTATESAAWKESLQKFGWDSAFLPGDEYKRFLDEDVKRITAIIDSLGLRK